MIKKICEFFKKHLLFYKKSWLTLIGQFVIEILVLVAIGNLGRFVYGSDDEFPFLAETIEYGQISVTYRELYVLFGIFLAFYIIVTLFIKVWSYCFDKNIKNLMEVHKKKDNDDVNLKD